MRSPCLQTTGKIFSKWFNGGIEKLNVDPLNRLIGGYFVPQTVQEAEKPGCIICEYAVTELVDYLDNNKTEVAIEKALVRLCLKLPKSVKVTHNAVPHSLSFEHLSNLSSGQSGCDCNALLHLAWLNMSF